MSSTRTQRVFTPVVLFHNTHTALPQPAIEEYKEKIGQMMERNAKLWSFEEVNVSPSKKRRRGNLPKKVTEFLKQWLIQHKKHPYPSEKEKIEMARQTGLSVHQISNWFINARRRILQPMLQADLDIYCYKDLADTDKTWAFGRTKMTHFDIKDSYSVAIS